MYFCRHELRSVPALMSLLIAATTLCCQSVVANGDEPTPADPSILELIDDAFTDLYPGILPPAAPSDGCGADAGFEAGQTLERTLIHDGLERSAGVYIPAGYSNEGAAPLVFVLHGGGGSGEQIETASAEFNPIADREGFVVVYPDGVEGPGILGVRTWNGGGCCGHAAEAEIDDVGFLMALLDELTAELCVDERRVYSTGMSNGAIMSYRLAIEEPDRIAAIAAVAAPQFVDSQASGPVPVLHIHGTDDPNAPLEGGEGCGLANVIFPSVMEGLERWRQVNSCVGVEEALLSVGDGQCELLGQCEVPVVRCLIDGGGHSWPGGHPPVLRLRRCQGGDHHSTTFPASEIIWGFFRTQALAAF